MMIESYKLSPGTLVDWQLLELGPLIIDGYRFEHVNPATINLALGNLVVLEAGEIIDDPGRYKNYSRRHLSDGLVELDIREATSDRPLYVSPGCWLLSETREYLKMPQTCQAEIMLRSSAARRGWNHANACYIDPGFTGRPTLELINHRHHRSLPLYPGIVLVQLRIDLLANTPNHPYSGRYDGDESVNICQDDSI